MVVGGRVRYGAVALGQLEKEKEKKKKMMMMVMMMMMIYTRHVEVVNAMVEERLTLITRYRGGSRAILVNSLASSLKVGRTFSSIIQPVDETKGVPK